MRVEDLDLKELLELDPQGGLVQFAGQRQMRHYVRFMLIGRK